MGTFKSGVENIPNAKPAKLRADATEAKMPARGRKPKSALVPDPQIVQTKHLKTSLKF